VARGQPRDVRRHGDRGFAVQRPGLRRLQAREGIASDADREELAGSARRQRYIAYAITTAVGSSPSSCRRSRCCGDPVSGTTAAPAAGPAGMATADAAGRVIRRAAITNLGCRVNQAEMDAVERLLRLRGIEVVADGAAADLHLVNTCTVTAVADDKSRKAVRRARRTSPGATLLVTGCSVAVERAAFARRIPAPPSGQRREGRPPRRGGAAPRERAAPTTAAPGGRRARTVSAAAPPVPPLAGVEIEGIADGRARIDRARAT